MFARSVLGSTYNPIPYEAPPQLRVAIIDDSRADAFLLEKALFSSGQPIGCIDHFSSLNEFLLDHIPSPDVVLLDRVMPDTVLAEARIQDIKARHNGCGVVMNTSMMTPSLRSTAAHEGALTVVEKGTITPHALGLLVASAAALTEQMPD